MVSVSQLTLDTVVDFSKHRLALELCLMDDDITNCSRPVRRQTVISGYPFGANICVHLYSMRLPII